MRTQTHTHWNCTHTGLGKKMASTLLALMVCVGLGSCEKTKDDINKATEFDMNYSTEFTIPSADITPPAGVPSGTMHTVDFNTPEISTGSASRFASESTTKDLVEEIKMTKFNISNPSGNLNYLKSFSIFLKTSNLGDVLVATRDSIPENVSSVDAVLKDVNIKDHIFKDKIQFKVTATLWLGTGTSGDQKLKTSQTVHVKGKKI